MNLETATQYANELIDLLNPSCIRIEIAGGIRRKKAEPHDIELVAIPLVSGGEWVEKQNWLDVRIKNLFEEYPDHFIPAPKDKAGKKAPFGLRYYKFLYKLEQVDLFVVLPPAQWGVIFTIRTGDAEFSHWLVQQGWKKRIKVFEGRLVQHSEFSGITTDMPLNTPEEQDVFRILEVPYTEPEKRIGIPQIPLENITERNYENEWTK